MSGAGSQLAPSAAPAWARTPSGWAVNLDGSAAHQFALPRLEIERSPLGWVCRCRLADGSEHELADHPESIASAQRAAAEWSREWIGDAHLAAVRRLLGER